MKKDFFNMFLFFAILTLIFAPLSIFQYFLLKDQDKIIEKFGMFYLERNNELFKEGEITGLYFGDYIAVWTKDRSWEEIMRTCNHEWAHSIGMNH